MISQSNLKWNSRNEQYFNAIDASPMIFGIIFPPNPRGKNSTTSQIYLGTIDENRNSKDQNIIRY